MKPAKFFQSYPTRDDLEAEVYAHPELYGKTSISQFIKDNLPLESAFQAEIIKALRGWQKKAGSAPTPSSGSRAPECITGTGCPT